MAINVESICLENVVGREARNMKGVHPVKIARKEAAGIEMAVPSS